jgi:uncharacterized OsmC-like protein
MAEQIVNGINVEALRQSIHGIKADPELAKFRFRVANSWISGTNNRARIKGFYGVKKEHERSKELELGTYDIDEPQVLLGNDKGPNPVEWVLVALSGCVTTSLVAFAAAKGIELRSVETELEGDLDVRGFLNIDPNVRNGYQQIRLKFNIDSDASDEQLEELVEIAKQRSPVFDIVTNKVQVESSFERIRETADA